MSKFFIINKKKILHKYKLKFDGQIYLIHTCRNINKTICKSSIHVGYLQINISD